MDTPSEATMKDVLKSLRSTQDAFEVLAECFKAAPASDVVYSTLDRNIKKAIHNSVDDEIIYRRSDGSFAFIVDGEEQFYDNLVSLCTAAEKTELLHEWLLTGDEERAVEVVDYLMADFNPIRAIARASAVRIINHSLFLDWTADCWAAANN